MAYARYRIRDSAYPHFITSAIVRWLPTFRSQPRTEVILDSLRFLRNEGSIYQHAYVVMEDHIHLIASSPDLGNVRRFLSFTARQIIDHLTESGRQLTCGHSNETASIIESLTDTRFGDPGFIRKPSCPIA
jgi:putative transposase